MDLWDLLAAVHSDPEKGQPPTYPRPVEQRPKGKVSQRPRASQEVIRKALAARGHGKGA